MNFLSNIILANYFNKIKSSLKRQCTHDNLKKPSCKFFKCYSFQINTYQSHLSSFIIHRFNSFHNNLVNNLLTVVNKSHLNNSNWISSIIDKENIDLTTLNCCYNKAEQCLWCKSLQEYADIEGNMSIENNNASISQECWVTYDEELYSTVTGSLVRSFEYEWETSKWMCFKDEVFAGENLQLNISDTPVIDCENSGILKLTSCNFKSSTLHSISTPHKAGFMT